MNKEFLDYLGLSLYDTKIKEKINSVKLELSTEINSKVSISEMKISGVNNNGYEYVDLGLPSGTLWATMNIGANSVTNYGNYYQYGAGTTTYQNTDQYYTGNENILPSQYDTATQAWGGDWHMPTKTLFEELIANTTYEWTTINGFSGGKFTAQNGNYVFFVAAGIWGKNDLYESGSGGTYRSSSPSGSNLAYGLYFDDSGKKLSDLGRTGGCSVRGVIEISELDKYATNAQLSDYIQKSQTSGLLKNDGTVDTNLYLTRDEIIQLILETINQ